MMIEAIVGGMLALGLFVAGGVYSVKASRRRDQADLERRILQLAREQRGRLAATDVALRTARTLEESEAALSRLVRSGRADPVAGEQGGLVYEFVEFLPPARPGSGRATPGPAEEGHTP